MKPAETIIPQEDPLVVPEENLGDLDKSITVTKGNYTVKTKPKESDGNNFLKAAAIATGIGLAAGAAAYEADKKMKEKGVDDENYSYEYESEPTEHTDLGYTEVSDEGLNAFSGGEM